MKRCTVQIRRKGPVGQGGFTLIELLVVIAVLAILAAVVVLNVAGFANQGSSAAACTDAKSVQTAIDAALSDGTFPMSVDTTSHSMVAAEWNDLVPNYLHTGPPGSGLAGVASQYGAVAPAWTLTGTGDGGWNVQVGIGGC